MRENEVSTLIPILDRDRLIPFRALRSLTSNIPTRPSFTHVIHLLDISAANTANARSCTRPDATSLLESLWLHRTSFHPPTISLLSGKQVHVFCNHDLPSFSSVSSALFRHECRTHTSLQQRIPRRTLMLRKLKSEATRAEDLRLEVPSLVRAKMVGSICPSFPAYIRETLTKNQQHSLIQPTLQHRFQHQYLRYRLHRLQH